MKEHAKNSVKAVESIIGNISIMSISRSLIKYSILFVISLLSG